VNGSLFVFTPADVFGLVLLAAAAFLAGMTVVPRTTIALLVLFIGLGVAKCAHADPVTIGVHVGSMHVPAREFNNVNPGLYVRASDWQIGAYRNSYRKRTAYLVYAWELGDGYEMFTGGATGYRNVWHHGAVAPMVAFSRALPVRLLGVQPRLTFMLPTPKTSAVAHLSMEF
jgi:hypothetical protein